MDTDWYNSIVHFWNYNGNIKLLESFESDIL